MWYVSWGPCALVLPLVPFLYLVPVCVTQQVTIYPHTLQHHIKYLVSYVRIHTIPHSVIDGLVHLFQEIKEEIMFLQRADTKHVAGKNFTAEKSCRTPAPVWHIDKSTIQRQKVKLFILFQDINYFHLRGSRYHFQKSTTIENELTPLFARQINERHSNYLAFLAFRLSRALNFRSSSLWSSWAGNSVCACWFNSEEWPWGCTLHQFRSSWLPHIATYLWFVAASSRITKVLKALIFFVILQVKKTRLTPMPSVS